MDEITREEQFMAAAGGKAVDLPTPITREEMYLAKAAGLNVTIPEPITRREKFLSKISANSGGGDTGWDYAPIYNTNYIDVGQYAFAANPYIKTVNIQYGRKVDEAAFMYCENLESVYINVGGTSARFGIADNAFFGCTAFKEVELHGVGSIDARAFSSNTNLETVVLKGGKDTTGIENPIFIIGESAFYGCAALRKIHRESAGLLCEKIKNDAFALCESLEEIRLADCRELEARAFLRCTSLDYVRIKPPRYTNGVYETTSIGESAFEGCTSLTTVDLISADSIGDSAFYGCTNLSTLILRNTDAVCQLIVTAVLGTKIVTMEGAPTGEGFIYVPSALYEGYVTLIAQQTAMLLMSQGMGEAEAQVTADYIARAVLRKIEDYPEICG